MNIDLLYFLGFNLDESLLWHSAISCTHQLYGEVVSKELFEGGTGFMLNSSLVGLYTNVAGYPYKVLGTLPPYEVKETAEVVLQKKM